MAYSLWSRKFWPVVLGSANSCIVEPSSIFTRHGTGPLLDLRIVPITGAGAAGAASPEPTTFKDEGLRRVRT